MGYPNDNPVEFPIYTGNTGVVHIGGADIPDSTPDPFWGRLCHCGSCSGDTFAYCTSPSYDHSGCSSTGCTANHPK